MTAASKLDVSAVYLVARLVVKFVAVFNKNVLAIYYPKAIAKAVLVAATSAEVCVCVESLK